MLNFVHKYATQIAWLQEHNWIFAVLIAIFVILTVIRIVSSKKQKASENNILNKYNEDGTVRFQRDHVNYHVLGFLFPAVVTAFFWYALMQISV